MSSARRHRIRPSTLATARALRKAQPSAEQKLWARLRAGQLAGLKFRRQHPIGRFIADFCCPAHRLVIEIDGDSHAERVTYDAARTAWLEGQGYRVIRFLNDDVHHRLEAVLEAIVAECQAPGDSQELTGGQGDDLLSPSEEGGRGLPRAQEKG